MVLSRKIEPILIPNGRVDHLLADVALVGLQHLLPSVVPLFARFCDMGIASDSIFLLGKPYSTIPSVILELEKLGCKVYEPTKYEFELGKYADYFRSIVDNFWEWVLRAIPPSTKRIVILDEGGWLRWAVPASVSHKYSVTAVEHTMYGVHPIPLGGRAFPVILMAASAAKTQFESPVIAQAIIEKVSGAVKNLEVKEIGVIGIGNIGQAVVECLRTKGFKSIYGFDIDATKCQHLSLVRHASSVCALVGRCDVILGCAGQDSLEPHIDFQHASGKKWLASCSSGDFEFLRVAATLADEAAVRPDPFADLVGMIGDTEVILLNGGFPVNFDRIAERESEAHIQLTRELTFASVVQAAFCLRNQNQNSAVMLDPQIQRELVEALLVAEEGDNLSAKTLIHDASWWEANSAGQRLGRRLGDVVMIK